MPGKGKKQAVILGSPEGITGQSVQAKPGAVDGLEYERQPSNQQEHTNAIPGPSKLDRVPPEQDGGPIPDTPNEPDVVKTVELFNTLSKGIQNVRRGIAKTNVEVERLHQDLQETRRIKEMTRSRRNRLETFVENYQRQKRRLSWETLWGSKNGKVVVNTMATDADHHNQLYMSESELEAWGVDVSQIPDRETMKKAHNQKRKRSREGDEAPQAKKKRIELVNGVFTLAVDR